MNLKIINYFKYFIKRKKKLVLILEQYVEFLDNGTYSLQPSYAYKKNYKVFFKNELKNLFIKVIFYKNINIFSKNKLFDGKIIFVNTREHIKIFGEKSVLSFSRNFDIQNILSIYKKVDNFFNYPKIIDVQKEYFIEEFIFDSKIKNLEELNVIYNILLKFYLKQKIELDKAKKIDIEWKKLTLKNRDFIQSLNYNSTYPYVLSHNDIHFGNILKNDKLYVIDWEYFGKNLFFYDFINILFIEALEGDRSFLDYFFNGKLDVQFEELFAIFNLSYHENNKVEYFDTYLLQKILLRDMKKPKNHLNSVLDKYQKVRSLYCEDIM